jgi:hypothetical protein
MGKCFGSGGIRTHASEETNVLKQCLYIYLFPGYNSMTIKKREMKIPAVFARDGSGGGGIYTKQNPGGRENFQAALLAGLRLLDRQGGKLSSRS